jgi:predicted tellurium resistance membrane protein TerC
MDWITDPNAYVALLTLTVLEVVLGIDNLVFLSILSGRLPPAEQPRARRWGLAMALLSRLALLGVIGWIIGLTAPWFSVWGHDVSGRDLILLLGGLFLLAKATSEIHHKLEGAAEDAGAPRRAATFAGVVAQIAALDLVFSLDSVITAVGMVGDRIGIMVVAIVISMVVMLAFVNPICAFVERHPTVKMLALSFLLLIGFTLVAEGFHVAIPHGYVYFAMGFSVFVEVLNLRLRKAGKPVVLHGPQEERREP